MFDGTHTLINISFKKSKRIGDTHTPQSLSGWFPPVVEVIHDSVTHIDLGLIWVQMEEAGDLCPLLIPVPVTVQQGSAELFKIHSRKCRWPAFLLVYSCFLHLIQPQLRTMPKIRTIFSALHLETVSCWALWKEKMEREEGGKMVAEYYQPVSISWPTSMPP